MDQEYPRQNPSAGFWTKSIWARRLRLPLLFLLFFGLLATRRWAQLAFPQVWDDESTLIMTAARGGWGQLFHPINGYLVVLPRAIVRISMAVSFYHYPLVATLLTWLFTASVGVAIATAPTHLKGKVFCAVAAFAIPTDPEVFGVALYTLWWAAILMFLVALWDEKQSHPGLRWTFLLAGGLSSPAIVGVLPILYFRAFWYRAFRLEWAIALAATLLAAVQLHFVAAGSAASLTPMGSLLRNVIPRFCGWFIFGNISASPWLLWVLGLGVLGLILAWWRSDRRSPGVWILTALWLSAIALSVMRVDPGILNPRYAGSRYFFFPYILLGWILVQAWISASAWWVRTIIAAAAAGILVNAAPAWSRGHDDLQWEEHVRSGRLFPIYITPTEFAGSRLQTWFIEEPGPGYARLLRGDWLISARRLDALTTFAYKTMGWWELDNSQREIDLKTELGAGARPGTTQLETGRAIITRPWSGSSPAEIEFSLKRGDRLRYRSGPVSQAPLMRIVGREEEFIGELPVTPDWAWLEFSNSRLPAEFVLRVRDRGQGLGEWSTVGIPSP